MKTLKTSHILLSAFAGISMTIALTVSAGNMNQSKSEHTTDESMATMTTSAMAENNYKKAYFAGGCFWCVEANYEKVDGVIEVISGYSGGTIKNPTYKQVSSGMTQHVESVEVIYDPDKISYNDLLNELWHLIDPTDATGSFVDRGPHYRSIIFYTNKEEKALAEQSIQALSQSGRYDKPIATEITPFKAFYNAEDYHQDYYKKNPIRYKYYRFRSGRDQYLEKIWGKTPDKSQSSALKNNSDNTVNTTHTKKQMAGTYMKPSNEELKKKLTDLQYKVTQEEGTERPFQNEYWEQKSRYLCRYCLR